MDTTSLAVGAASASLAGVALFLRSKFVTTVSAVPEQVLGEGTAASGGKVVLHQMSPPPGKYASPSPFCFAVEVFMRMANIEYEAKEGDFMNAPRGKLPFVEDGGARITDSWEVVQHLVLSRGGADQSFGGRLCGQLDAEREGILFALHRMLVNDLYWRLVYDRWIEPEGYKAVCASFFGHAPLPVRLLVPPLARRGIYNDCWAHGVGRESASERARQTSADLAALSAILGSHTYLSATTKPHLVDAFAFAFLHAIIHGPPTPVQAVVAKHVNLGEYVERIISSHFAEHAADGAAADADASGAGKKEE